MAKKRPNNKKYAAHRRVAHTKSVTRQKKPPRRTALGQLALFLAGEHRVRWSRVGGVHSLAGVRLPCGIVLKLLPPVAGGQRRFAVCVDPVEEGLHLLQHSKRTPLSESRLLFPLPDRGGCWEEGGAGPARRQAHARPQPRGSDAWKAGRTSGRSQSSSLPGYFGEPAASIRLLSRRATSSAASSSVLTALRASDETMADCREQHAVVAAYARLRCGEYWICSKCLCIY